MNESKRELEFGGFYHFVMHTQRHSDFYHLSQSMMTKKRAITVPKYQFRLAIIPFVIDGN